MSTISELRRDRFLTNFNDEDYIKLIPIVTRSWEYFDNDFFQNIIEQSISPPDLNKIRKTYGLLLEKERLIEAEDFISSAYENSPLDQELISILVDIYCRRKMIFHAYHFLGELDHQAQPLKYSIAQLKCFLLSGRYAEAETYIQGVFAFHKGDNEFIALCWDVAIFHSSGIIMRLIAESPSGPKILSTLPNHLEIVSRRILMKELVKILKNVKI